MIYFDNAATTNYKPQPVIDAALDCIRNLSFNPNRGGSKGGFLLEQKILSARAAVSAFLNNDSSENIIFSQNCTTALNLGILGTVKKGGHVITTVTEHNSVLRPLMQLKSRGFVEVSFVRPDSDGVISADLLLKELQHNTYLVVLNHVSNVTGQAQDLKQLCHALKSIRPDISILVDAAQSTGYVPIDMKRWQVDMLAFPAHKGLHGIQGTGVLALCGNCRPRPVVFGGTGTESQNLLQPTTVPDGLEAGTPNCPAILALGAAIEFWAGNFPSQQTQIAKLQNILQNGLKLISNVKIHSQKNASGIVAFNVGDFDSSQVADLLGEGDIAVRAGLHCAPLMHKWLNTVSQGAVRASVSFNNTEEECFEFLNAVNSIAKKLTNNVQK